MFVLDNVNYRNGNYRTDVFVTLRIVAATIGQTFS